MWPWSLRTGGTGVGPPLKQTQVGHILGGGLRLCGQSTGTLEAGSTALRTLAAAIGAQSSAEGVPRAFSQSLPNVKHARNLWAHMG